MWRYIKTLKSVIVNKLWAVLKFVTITRYLLHQMKSSISIKGDFTTAGGESGIYLYASDDINNINFYEWEN